MVILCRRVDLIGEVIIRHAKENTTKSANLFAHLKTCITLVSMQPADDSQAEDESETETKI